MERLYNLALAIQKCFRNFYLAGRTALMFKFNYRVSIDLDCFSESPFSFRRLSAKLRQNFKVNKEDVGVDNVDFFIENVKVSFVFFPFKNVRPLEEFKNIKKADDYDVFLNKIYVAGRRNDPKDPFDAGFFV